MSADAFVRGKRLIDPVTGRVRGDDDEDDSIENLERESMSSKRARISDVEMVSENGSLIGAPEKP